MRVSCSVILQPNKATCIWTSRTPLCSSLTVLFLVQVCCRFVVVVWVCCCGLLCIFSVVFGRFGVGGGLLILVVLVLFLQLLVFWVGCCVNVRYPVLLKFKLSLYKRRNLEIGTGKMWRCYPRVPVKGYRGCDK